MRTTSGRTSEPLVRLHNISKRFPGVQALAGVDLTLDRGEIHGLVGENGSGKSTLIKILAGVEAPDPGGWIEFQGQRTHHWKRARALHSGVEVIYQDLALFPNLTVAENIAFGRLTATHTLLVRWKRLRQLAEQALARIDAGIDLDATVGTLSLANQQLVAIARALTGDVRLLIMDEPTASLTGRDIDTLLTVVRGLQARGVSILFVSHKLDEVFEIAQRVTVLRDGRRVATELRAQLTPKRLVWLMSGRAVDRSRYVFRPRNDGPLLEVKGLGKSGQFRAVDFQLFPGEIIGFAGLRGAGRTALGLSLFGLNPPDTGKVLIDGQPRVLRGVQDAVRCGIALVPENRASEGLVMVHSVGRNAILPILGRLRNRLGFVTRGRVEPAVVDAAERVALRAASYDVAAETLSGGNQQRLVLAKWLATQPRILILDGPTVGIDIAAKGQIHQIIRRLARAGLGIVMISDEVPELLANCNRILLMAHGTLICEWDAQAITESEIRAQLLQT